MVRWQSFAVSHFWSYSVRVQWLISLFLALHASIFQRQAKKLLSLPFSTNFWSLEPVSRISLPPPPFQFHVDVRRTWLQILTVSHSLSLSLSLSLKDLSRLSRCLSLSLSLSLSIHFHFHPRRHPDFQHTLIPINKATIAEGNFNENHPQCYQCNGLLQLGQKPKNQSKQAQAKSQKKRKYWEQKHKRLACVE